MKKISETNIDILDGDRGKNYPSPNELYKNGFCLFLSNKNIVGNRLNLEDCAYITEERKNNGIQKNFRHGIQWWVLSFIKIILTRSM